MTPVVYLHGFASSPASKKARFFRQKLEELGIDVTVPDLAAGRFERLTLTGQLRVIDSAVSGRRASLIGSSLGGFLAALYAARHPAIERVVLLAPAFGFSARWAETLAESKMAEWRETGELPVFHYGEGSMRPVGYELYEDGLRYEDFPDVRQPALVFHGSGDTVVPPESSVRFAANRPNVELHIVDSDHELISALDEMWERMGVFLAAPAAGR